VSAHHRATQGLLKSRNKVVGRFRDEIQATTIIGEALSFGNATFIPPGQAFHPQADDVNGEMLGNGVKLLANAAGRPTARILAVGQDNDHTGFTTEVENFGSLLDSFRQRCAPSRL
jgi:hypothetical protein